MNTTASNNDSMWSTKVVKMNTTASNNDSIWGWCIPDPVQIVVFQFLHSIVFLASLALNSLAVWIFFRIPTTSTFMVYLKNLVVADILMTLTIPVRVLCIAGVMMPSMCTYRCGYYLFMYISIIFLGLISLDRCLKIVRPFGVYAVQKVRVGQALSATVWTAAVSGVILNYFLFLNSQVLLPIQLELDCIMHLVSTYISQVVFWITLALVVVCYTFISRKVYESYKASRSSSEGPSRQTEAKVFVVVAVFFICFVPIHFAFILNVHPELYDTASSCREINTFYETTVWLSTTNVCLDPLIYIFLCKKFWTQLVATLTCKL